MHPLAGVSLPYFFDAYGHDLAPNAFLGTGPRAVDPMAIYRPLLEARELGFQAVRIWLCEGGEGILMDGATISGVHPVLIESVAIIQECASLVGLKLYWTLLDGPVRRGDAAAAREILTQPDQTARFAERVGAPLVRRLDPHLTFAIEIVSEPEALVAGTSCGGWEVVGAAVKVVADAVRSEHGRTLVTAGLRHDTLPAFWQGGAGLTALDVHIPTGVALPARATLVRALATPASTLPVIAGVAARDMAAQNPTVPAVRDEYDAVFLWRLEGDLIDTSTAQRTWAPLAHEVKAALAARPLG